jgi:glycosyltransferase involved in cell wall biosynthesis
MSSGNLFLDEYPNRVPSNVIASVCLITYNHAPYISQAIESVLSQEASFPYEICIGEDDSTDGTREICLEYAKKYPDKIRLFLRKEEDKIYINGEKTGKYNFIETRLACRGKYVALLEGDDYWIDNQKIQKQVDYMDQHPDCMFTAGRTLKEFTQTGEMTVVLNSTKDGKVSYTDLFRGIRGHTSSFCYRNHIMDIRDPIYIQSINGDWLSQLLLLEKGGTGFIHKDTFSVYRSTGSGIWSAKNSLQKFESNLATIKLYRHRVPCRFQKKYVRMLTDWELRRLTLIPRHQVFYGFIKLLPHYPSLIHYLPMKMFYRLIRIARNRIIHKTNN